MAHDDIDELLTEAYEHLRNGRFRMALTAAKNVYEQRPDDYRSLNCLAWATLENGNPAQALELANLAVQLSNDDVNARLYRGYLLMRMSIFEGAIQDLDWSIERTSDSVSWALLNKARSLAGLGRYFEGLEEIEKAIQCEKENKDKLLQIRGWFRRTLGYDQGFFSGLLSKKPSPLKDAAEAFRQKEYWFSLWAARETLNTPALKKEHQHAYLVELESLLAMFQIKPAIEKAESLKSLLNDDERFRNIYNRLLKLASPDYKYADDEPVHTPLPADKTNFDKFNNKLFNVVSAKTYNVMQYGHAKRTYLLKFSEETVRYIGVEVIIDNPFFNNKNIDIEGTAVWYLNSIEVGRHQFNLSIEKSWKYLEFIQTWGTENPGFWQSGQGRVDILLSGDLICSRWFVIGESEQINFEESDAEFDEIEQSAGFYQQPQTDHEILLEKPSLPLPVNAADAPSKSLDELLKELDDFVGLDSVKQSMSDFVAYLNFIQERKKSGFKTGENLSINCIFLGKPGTGKTMIARLLGRIFKEMGILSNGHIVEVDRSGLVGQYIGETAQKTSKVINEAMGGLLFIDEAYSLKKEGNQQDFGQEAIDTLLKRMEDENGKFVVIAAGYPDEMNIFINSNPGFKSRFTHFFNFEDYTPEELVEIFKQIASREEYSIHDDALELIKKDFTALYRTRDNSFGNARMVKNYFYEAKIQLSKRYLKMPEKEKSQQAMTTIFAEDIKALQKSRNTKTASLGIDEESLAKALARLNKLTGLSAVKQEINEIVKLARFYIEQGENINTKFSSHLVFLGSPGTGKTTVARLFGEIYSALGILPKGHLVEVDRQGLVGSFVGQTAQKTKELIDKAIGGTLFIDEAYSLVKKDDGSDFGKEAIDTLLKRMEDDRGRFVVIAAGYTDEMNKFLQSNPGLQSRFNRTIVFEDYSPEELLSIADNLFQEKEKELDEAARDQLKKYFNKLYRNREKNFGNGRIVRNLVDAALKNHLLRIADIPSSKRNESDVKIIRLEDIKHLVSLKKEKDTIKVEGDPELLDQYLKELHELVGLDSVKKSVDRLISGLKVAKLREQRGMKVIPKNLHAVFTGNPGTGKTSIARLLSKIYKEMGILEKGHLIEVDRTALVAGYQGQTAAKTDAVITSALGGTLFIDEAYSLSRVSNDFGREAIETLIKQMEVHAGELVVIVAGYTTEMKEFIDSNPGLASRFTNHFVFEDFTPRQMLEIALIISQKNGYKLDEGAWQMLLDIFTGLYNKRDSSFGNARTVRNILYKAISNQEERILSLIEPTDEDLCTISYEDVDSINIYEITG